MMKIRFGKNRSKNSEKGALSLNSVRYAFKNIIWPRRYLLSLGLFFILLNRISGLVLPGMTQKLIDEVITKGNQGLLNTILLLVGAAVLVKSISAFVLTQLLSVEAQHLISKLRVQVQKHILRLPLSFFDNSKTGTLVSRIMNDVEGIRNLVGTGLVHLCGGILTASVALFLLLRIHVKLTLLALVPLMLFSLLSLKAFTYLRPIFKKRWELYGEVNGRLTESLSGIRVIKGFNAELREEETFQKGIDRLFQNIKKTLTMTSLVTSFSTLLMGLVSLAIMGFGSHLIFEKQITIGDFVAFTLYLGFLIAPIVQMSDIGSQLTEAFAGLDRMEEILKVTKENEERPRPHILKEIHGEICFENVSFAY